MKKLSAPMLWLGGGAICVLLLVAIFVVWPAIERSNDVNDIVLAANFNGIDADSREVGTWFDALDKCLSEQQAKHAIVGFLNMDNANLPLVKALILMTCPYSDMQRIKHGGD